MIELKDDELESAINNKANARKLIFFCAEWCGPCKILTENLEKIESEFSKNYTFIKIDIGNGTTNIEKFGIKNVPTVILMKDQKEITRFLGAKSPEHIRKILLEQQQEKKITE